MMKSPKLAKLLVKATLRHFLFFIDSNPKFRRYVFVVFNVFGLSSTAREFYAFLAEFRYQSITNNYASSICVVDDIKYLTPHARNVYVDLNAAIECCKREESK